MVEQPLCLDGSHLTFPQAILLGSLGPFPDDILHGVTVFWKEISGSSTAAVCVIRLATAPVNWY